ncbi:tyrosine-type recombinase/integrase [Streptomyces ochraceiscleroticus]|uniref:Tyrosine-type recombinase/integrase n=1 Tax=Streptomyces ochraceiscleroticus TaxID=47761 RepID=A0ABW1MKN0_9ACTN|nr:tyrosine-type recombinase/integrase [Streptomyces ochraceiscleroticus]
MLTFEFTINSIRERPGRRKPFQLRWKVGPRPHYKSFQTKALADGRRAQLMTAAHRGEMFDVESGLPQSDLRAQQPQATWIEHARDYARMKWKRSSAKSRATRADALATVTSALVLDAEGAPEPAVLRRALSCWAFNLSNQRTEPPMPIASALQWIVRKSLPMPRLENSDTVRLALEALSLKLDGTPAAASTIKRKRMVFNNALRYAVERKLLPANPLQFVDWAPPEADDEVDWRYVPNPAQAKVLIDTVGKLGPRGRHLQAFFGCGYYAATRPAEAMNLRQADCTLPTSGWGTLLLTGSSPRAGSSWTDDGKSYEERGLKRRTRSATREVPIPPVLVALLHEHLACYGTGPDGRLFRASRGGVLLTKEYAEVWKRARKAALSEEQLKTPLAEVPYSLRHAGVSLWLASGVDPAEVARRAGHSVAVLYRFYAKVLDGKRDQANALIETALREASESGDEDDGRLLLRDTRR